MEIEGDERALPVFGDILLRDGGGKIPVVAEHQLSHPCGIGLDRRVHQPGQIVREQLVEVFKVRLALEAVDRPDEIPGARGRDRLGLLLDLGGVVPLLRFEPLDLAGKAALLSGRDLLGVEQQEQVIRPAGKLGKAVAVHLADDAAQFAENLPVEHIGVRIGGGAGVLRLFELFPLVGEFPHHPHVFRVLLAPVDLGDRGAVGDFGAVARQVGRHALADPVVKQLFLAQGDARDPGGFRDRVGIHRLGFVLGGEIPPRLIADVAEQEKREQPHHEPLGQRIFHIRCSA